MTDRLLLPGEYDKGYVPVADGLRVICVMIVAWFHIWQQSWLSPVLKLGKLQLLDFTAPVRAGYMLVDVLLLLSGFLLFLPYARVRLEGGKLPDLRPYYAKRALRILPSYWLCLFIVLFCFALPRGEYGSTRHLAIDLTSHLTFTHNLFAEGSQNTKLNGVLWTLAVEVQFYVVAPFIGRAFVKRPVLTYAGMTAVAWLYRFAYVAGMANSAAHFNRLPAMLDVYANGMAAAWAMVFLKKHLKPRWWTALPAVLLCVAALAGIWLLMDGQSRLESGQVMRMGQMKSRFPLSLLGAAFLVAGSQAARWFQWLLSNRLVKFLAAISFNLYIWHQWLAVRLKEWHIPDYVSDTPQRAGEMPWQLHYTLLCFGAAIALAALITYCWEKPAARLGSKLLLKSRSGAR